MPTESIVEFARPVVVCVDGSPSAVHATRWAAAEAGRRDLPLRVVHVVSWPISAYAKEMAVNAELRTIFTTRSEKILSRARDTAHEVAPAVRVSTTSVPGTVVPTLVDWSRGAELLVLGSRGLGGFGALVVGSVAVAAVAHAKCPVAVVRGERDEPGDQLAPILVGVDASPAGAAAVAFAVEEAMLRKVPLVAAHGWLQPAWETLHEVGYARDRADELDAQARAMVDRYLAPWQAKHPDLKVTQVVRRGGAAALLVGETATAQLVVVGSRGHGALTGLALGSTSQQLLRHADCPVVVTRAEDTRGD